MRLIPEHEEAAIAALPESTIAALKAFGRITFVAGGFLRAVVARETINDVDIFSDATVRTEHLVDRIRLYKDDEFHTRELETHDTANAVSIDTKPCTQVIRRSTHATPAQCIATFDFTICQAALWWDDTISQWRTECTPLFYPDLAARRLRYTGYTGPAAPDPMSPAIRVLKFYECGYVIDEHSYRSIILNAGKPVELPEDLAKKENRILTRCTRTY